MTRHNKRALQPIIAAFIAIAFVAAAPAQTPPKFKAIAFYTGTDRTEEAHNSFVREANQWFAKAAAENGFSYESTTNWNSLNAEFLARYQVVLFLDTRPNVPAQRAAFQKYTEQGGAWMGFHYTAFALTPSGVPQNWDWYHNQFLGSGEYKSNVWRPSAAVLRVEDTNCPATKGLPVTFRSAPNEWYRWCNDLRTNKDIDILCSIDPSSFPLGTGPKASEIWHSGYYPVVWSNRHYHMVYFNMGHNDLDGHNHNKELSFTFSSEMQNQLIITSLLWLGNASAN